MKLHATSLLYIMWSKIRLIPEYYQITKFKHFCRTLGQTVKSEALDKQELSEKKKYLQHALREYLAHYHKERNHLGIDNTIPFPTESVDNSNGNVRTKKRLGGLLKCYYRDAA